MRMIILALGALVVLGGGGAGAYFYFMKPAVASTGAEMASETKKVEKAEDAHGKAAAFVEMDPLILPIVDSEGVTQVLSLVVAIEVSDEAGKKAVEEVIPRLKDAYIQEMYGFLSKQAVMKAGVLQVALLKKKLNEISAEVLGEDSFNDVLLQVVQQRNI